ASRDRAKVDRQHRFGCPELAIERRVFRGVREEPLLAQGHCGDQREQNACDGHGDHELHERCAATRGESQPHQHGARVCNTSVRDVPRMEKMTLSWMSRIPFCGIPTVQCSSTSV